MDGKSILLMVLCLCASLTSLRTTAFGQNYERYAPRTPRELDPSRAESIPNLPDREPPKVDGDDRELVAALDAVVFVDAAEKISREKSIDSLEGIHYDMAASRSVIFSPSIKGIVTQYLGQPITLRRLNTMVRDIILQYQRCQYPIVDIQIPEQRITGGTVHLVVVETKIETVRVQPGCHFDCDEISRWIQCTQSGQPVYEPHLESDLLWLNQNPFRRVGVDFRKGSAPGTTDVIYQVHDVTPMRGYIGMDDTGVSTLNYGRFFAGFSYGNLFGRGGILGYQYTADEEFDRLEAHSASYTQPLNRCWSWQSYASWAGVQPALNFGLSQTGESWQAGTGLTRHLVRNRRERANLSLGVDFKSTNNNLEFAGATIAASNADLLQLRVGYDHLWRGCCLDNYQLLSVETLMGPGDGFTSNHNATAFGSIRPGTSPDYIYGRLRYDDSRVLKQRWQLVSRFVGQVSSERLLFSETLGLGGFDTIRGFDQRAYNADHGWIASCELGPCTYRWGCEHDPRSLRAFVFTDVGNAYLADPLPGEDASTFVASSGVGLRFNVSDRLTARFDWGYAWKDFGDLQRNDRLHFGVTWIPGPRPH